MRCEDSTESDWSIQRAKEGIRIKKKEVVMLVVVVVNLKRVL